MESYQSKAEASRNDSKLKKYERFEALPSRTPLLSLVSLDWRIYRPDGSASKKTVEETEVSKQDRDSRRA